MKRIASFILSVANVCAALAATTITPVPSAEAWTMKRDTTAFGAPYASRPECEAAARAHAETAGKSANYSCSDIRPFRVVYTATPTCPPQPADEVQTASCPAGSTGAWQQARSYVSVATAACWVAGPWLPPTPPSGACVATAPSGPVLYFSQAGDDANPGTQALPKRNLSSVNVNALADGTTLLFNRGDTWTNFSLYLKNPNATAARGITFDAYGEGERPTFQSSSGVAVLFGLTSDAEVDGGYTFRNLKLDGSGSSLWGFWVQGGTRNVTLDNNEITGFQIAIHAQNGTLNNAGLAITNNNIHHNSEMGILGSALNLVLDGNTIEANNFSGSGFNHGLYLDSHGANGIVRNNRFVNNSVLNGVCTGGNLTVHGQWDGLLIEGNTVQQAISAAGCWGISVNDGYASQEFFRNVTIRTNSIVNLECAICVRGAPNVLIEGNKIRSNQPDLPSGISVTPPNEAQDDQGNGATVRDNTICFVSPNPNGTTTVRVSVGGTVVNTNNVYRTGADATTGACAP